MAPSLSALLEFSEEETRKWRVIADGHRSMAGKHAGRSSADDWNWWAEYCDRRAEESRQFLDKLTAAGASANGV